MNIKISPSILASDFANLAAEIKRAEVAGADYIHVDVMDGHFVPNISIGPPVVKKIRHCTKLPFDVHLMIDAPEKYAQAFIDAGADIITFHVEASSLKNSNTKVTNLLNEIKKSGAKCGLVLKPQSAANLILPYIDAIDMVLIMTVEPGFGGQSFMLEMLPKIAKIHQLASDSNPNLLIEVDGGIDASTAKLCCQAGANVLVAGTYLFKADNMAKAMAALR